MVAGTIREKVPENFPLSQYHFERGFIDMMVPAHGAEEDASRFLLKTHACAAGGPDMSENPLRDKLAELKGLAERSNVDISRELADLELKLQLRPSARRRTRRGGASSWPGIPSGRRPCSTRR